MKEGISYIMFVLASLLLLQDGTVGEPRSQTVQIMCGDQPEHNSTAFVANFVSTMENISQQVRTSRFVVVATGSGPDTNYGLVQCYGDLSSRDCVLCYAQARNGLPQCYPFTSGRIYLDGCFMRSENYSFYEEYSGPEDTAVCGNTTRKGSDFEAAASRAVSKAVSNAPKNKGYARVQVRVSGTGNESAYVLADCWGSLSVNSCRICLKNALESVTGCLPWSEGRALNTGCFLRYSDTDFLNPMPGNGRSRGTVNVVAVATVSSAVLWVIAAVIGAYIWKHL